MRVAAPLALALLWSPAAGAGPVFERLSGAALGDDPCFARDYDVAHLRRNPRQKVTHFHLVRERVDVADENGPQRFTVRLGFRLRNDRDVYATNAVCTPAGDAADCAGEGDTGAFRITLAGDALRLAVARLEVEGSRGSSPDLARSDDRVFLLQPGRASACAVP
ncbi:MAG: hypothetical protein Q8S29_20265 [Phreatobacter sp.]|nr:hypothetical protein [Phreatobacter sp.]